MAVDPKTLLKKEIARLKEVVRTADGLASELRVSAAETKSASLANEFKRQQQIASNVRHEISELEKTLKTLK